jgi:muramidase (phage lysozyme)
MGTSPISTSMDQGVKAFLDLIAWSEGTSRSTLTKNNGYDVIVSGVDGPSILTSYADHPFAGGRAPVLVCAEPQLYSTAAGRYQLLLRWWEPYKAMLKLPDFSPASQDAVAIQQIKERLALPMIESGNIQGAIAACSNIWASLPGNDYAQAGGHTMEALLTQFNTLSGTQPGPASQVLA